MKNVLITGISKGIGKALAVKFLKEGYFVIGTSLTGSVDFSDKNLAVYKLDLSSEESIEKCSLEILKLENNIDILINSAGVLLDEEELTVIRKKLEKTLKINLVGPIDFTEHILEKVSIGGHIINISSSAGSLAHTGHPGSHFPGHYPAYKISKTAINMYTRTLALRLKDKIIVSSVHPGWVKTDMGGEEADITPEEAAENIYNFAITKPKTGEFWFKGEQMPW